MNDILSFAELFTQAKRCNLRLNVLTQTRNGTFSAAWRRDNPDSTLTAQFFPPAEHETPFLAALNAFVLADLTTGVKVEETVDGDLFG